MALALQPWEDTSPHKGRLRQSCQMPWTPDPELGTPLLCPALHPEVTAVWLSESPCS